MPQSPTQVDVLQIEPGSGDEIKLARDPVTGEITYLDAVTTTALPINSIAGLRSVENVLVVGTGGVGAQYTTIQSAINAVPDSASKSDPRLILVLPGVYSESVTLNKDGVWLISNGATITSSSTSTLEVVSSVGATPKRVVIQGFKIINTADGNNCIKITGGSGSTVGSDRIDILDCDLEASGVGTFQLDAQESNNIFIQRGSWSTSNATSICRVQQCANFLLSSVNGVKLLQLDYNSGGVVPSIATSTYDMFNVFGFGNLQSTLSGTGSLSISNCFGDGNLTLNGDQTAGIYNSKIGNLTINNTFIVTSRNVSRGSTSGSGVLSESSLVGTQSFVASNSEAVSFSVSQPDTNYHVSLEVAIDARAIVTNKLISGFTIEFPGGPQTTSVNFSVVRDS